MLNWTNFWDAVEKNHAFPAAGVALLIIGAMLYWFEHASRLLGRVSWQRADPYTPSRAYAARLRAAGDEAAARREEERLRDQRLLMMRYGRAMMVVGAVVLFLIALLK